MNDFEPLFSQDPHADEPQEAHATSPLLREQTPASGAPPQATHLRMPRSEMVLLIVEHHQTILRHLLFWLQDQPYHRARWHRRTSDMSLFEDSVLLDLKGLLIELAGVRQQYPFGYGPEQGELARQLQGRLSILKCEIEAFSDLCRSYLERLDGDHDVCRDR